ncbi:MAG: hypothetical protein IJ265_00890, partial [Oscillospiraceae bacterium]|nr:hypothetical protein [Oscillospiraceae bacterium]
PLPLGRGQGVGYDLCIFFVILCISFTYIIPYPDKAVHFGNPPPPCPSFFKKSLQFAGKCDTIEGVPDSGIVRISADRYII